MSYMAVRGENGGDGRYSDASVLTTLTTAKKVVLYNKFSEEVVFTVNWAFCMLASVDQAHTVKTSNFEEVSPFEDVFPELTNDTMFAQIDRRFVQQILIEA